jgi:nucleotide-binding universal stress UspA family protein
MNTILVPTDYSNTAFNALYYACELALKNDACLILLHVYDIPMVDANMAMELMSSMEKEIEQQTHQDLEQLMTKINDSAGGDRFNNLNVSYEARHGFALEQIIEVAEEKGAGMIVMGTTGASGIKEYLLGSNTQKVLEHSTIPLLAVPDNARFEGIERIVYASDLRESDKPALTQLARFARQFNAVIDVLHVFQHTDEEVRNYNNELTEWIREHIPGEQITFDSVYGTDKEEAVDRYIDDQNADILAMLTRKRNFFQRMFSSDLTKKMAYHTEIPLLAFHE